LPKPILLLALVEHSFGPLFHKKVFSQQIVIWLYTTTINISNNSK